MNILELLLGQIPEAIYFALFMIFAKDLKRHRALFTILMVVDYILLTRIIRFNVWFQIVYTTLCFINLKILYKEKAQITDVFLFAIASLVLMIISIASVLVTMLTFKKVIIANLLCKILLVAFLIITRTKLPKLIDVYKKIWNRATNKTKIIKSTTFRSLNVVIFNVMFYIIHLCMIFAIFQKGGV